MTQQTTESASRPPRTVESTDSIIVQGLSKSFGPVQALADVDLTVQRGEVFGLLGPNGAGKTTLTEILEGHVKPTSGTVRVLDMDPIRANRTVRNRLGIVPQKGSFELYLTVREHVALFAGYYRQAFPVDDVIELVGLSSKSGARVGRLSGGQQRRLDLALALVGDPDIVFLDEPTTGLDIEARDRAWETVQAIRAMGKTVFLTTHNMTEAQRLCDRVAVLHSGRVAAIGAPSSLLPDERGATISFRGDEAEFKRLPADLAERARFKAGRISMDVDDARGPLHALTTWAVDSDVALADLEVRRPDLEELYLSILAHRDSEGRTS
ncbi:ABC transporter ATP-binding protein [Glycomyces sp. TRM65418]|uniref:ABC transporter ATP-binding protein n=1 Tax=Glycomyces sp. TRM65418 TaxID=2867006 RepID=UPI001CE5B26A|nr:ABC transporter ATP-binding protein [Glycomyces sp. TRM65418]MCC3765522.1 ABC transporter ATP-binding protein [Glycomyces sp. TRM65418]QZD55129.1 ABC transporter ATP-binding protein [Glycomyces sp. TRM65418]